jgi:L-amino acid N-acyltransferase YncA
MTHVRPASLQDAAAIAAVHVQSWKGGYQGLLPEAVLKGLSVERRERWWSQWLAELGQRDRILVAERDGQVVGFASLGQSRDFDADDRVAEVYAIYVLPDCWRHGIGQALMRRSVDELLHAAFREARLWVLETNQRTRRFFDAAGWYFDGTTKPHIVGRDGEPDEAIDVTVVRYRIALTEADDRTPRG